MSQLTSYMIETRQNEKTYFSGDKYFTEILSAIETARNSIHFEAYIFKLDELGKRILKALGEAVKRQAQVSLTVDGLGSIYWLSQLSLETSRLGIALKIYHPLPNFFNPFSFTYHLGNLNRRNHRKLCLIDSRLAFVGSMNIDVCHLSEFYGNRAWRDTGVSFEGLNVSTLHTMLADPKYAISDSNQVLRLNNSFIRRKKYYREIKFKLISATKRIWITSPYFNPPPFLLYRLARAAKNGVDVRILTGREQEHVLLRWVYTYHYTYLLKHGVRIFEYLPSVLHAKSKIVDDWMTVGSANQNYRSYFYDLEADVILTADHTKNKLQQHFLNDLTLSQELNLKEWKERSIINKIIEKLLSLIRTWI